MTIITPTQEQLHCIETAKTNNRVVINAYAGSGKTTVLAMISNEIPLKSIYLAFNKSSSTSASDKFPSHVACRTTHSVAYAAFGSAMQHKLSRPKGAYVNVGGTGGEIARYYHIKDMAGTKEKVYATQLGLLVKNTVARFEQSDSDSLTSSHIPYGELMEMLDKGVDKKKVTDVVVKNANYLWRDRIDLSSDICCSHDTYLKMWQLSKPQLPYKVIYLDECQDSSLCIMDVIKIQKKAKIILVGDFRQNIYSWRGSVNVMDKLEGTVQCKLTKSFRFGKPIADIANYILENTTAIEGSEKVNSVVGLSVVNKELPYTVLCRTNAYLLEQAVTDIEDGLIVKIEIDVKDFIKLLESATELFKGNIHKIKHEKIIPFSNFDMITEDKTDRELVRVANMITSGRSQRIITVLTSYKNPTNPMITYTSAHKSKGMEFSQVILADDFPSHYQDKKWVGLSVENQNLLYVAATRAIDVLEYNSSVKEAIDHFGPKKPVVVPVAEKQELLLEAA